MKHESFVVDAFREGAGPGVLGRMLDILSQKQGASVTATSLSGRAALLDGNPAYGRLPDIMGPKVRRHISFSFLHQSLGSHMKTVFDVWNRA